MSASEADLRRAFYATQLGLTALQLASLSESDLEQLYFSTNPSATYARLGASSQVFTGQQIIKRPSSATSTPLLSVTDENNNNRFTFAIVAGAATQHQIYAKVNEPAILGLVGPNGNDYADFTFDGSNADVDVQNGDLNLRPLNNNHSVNIWSIAGTGIKLRIGSTNFTQTLDLSHDGTNAHLTSTAGYIGMQSDKFQVLQSGAINYTGPTAASAATGANGAPPAQVGGYLTWQVGGTTVHIPYYL